MNAGEKADVSLKEYFERILAEKDAAYAQRFEAQEKAIQAALTAQKEAVQKAETAAEKRFDSVNEFRAQLSDQAATFMPRREAESAMKAMTEKYEQLAKTNANNIDSIEHRMDRNEGRSSGLGAGWGYLIGGIGLIAAIVGIVFGFMNAKVERNAARIEQSIPVPVTAPVPLPTKEQPRK